MKKTLKLILIILTIVLFSCKEKSEKTITSNKIENLQPKINIKELESDFMKWWAYYNENIILSSNFKSLDEELQEIDKKEFLKKLKTGNFIPLKLKGEIISYRLHKLNSLALKSIRNTIKNESKISLEYFNLENTKFPEFNFTDINEVNYTNKNTKGKIIVFKTWFINCQACIEEFPELNELVNKYKNRDDIIFLSLATNSKSELDTFLQKKIFKYNVVPNQKEFIVKTLNFNIYPTHIIVDKSGIIKKVVNKASEMISFLKNQEQLTNYTSPPPPM